MVAVEVKAWVRETQSQVSVICMILSSIILKFDLTGDVSGF